MDPMDPTTFRLGLRSQWRVRQGAGAGSWAALALCLCLFSSLGQSSQADPHLHHQGQRYPQRLRSSLGIAAFDTHMPHEIHAESEVTNSRRLRATAHPHMPHGIHTESELTNSRQLRAEKGSSQEGFSPPQEASSTEWEASYTSSTQYPPAHEKPKPNLSAPKGSSFQDENATQTTDKTQNSNGIKTVARSWTSQAMEALFGSKVGAAEKKKRRRKKKRKGPKGLLQPRPMTPVADLTPGYVVCSQGAGPRCVRSPNGTYQVSSYKDTHGVMYCPKQYFYGYFSVQIKFQAGYTGGINTAFYLIDTTTPKNSDPEHAEIDLEFYGARNASRILMATNVFADGFQNLAQFKMPFDGSKKFHEYTIMWSNSTIIWFADRVPFRVLNRRPDSPWPTRPMQPMISVWDTSGWTPLKARYKNGPVNSWFRNFVSLGCASNATSPETGCAKANSKAWVWNRNLVAPQLQSYMRKRSKLLIKDWGWDKTRPA